MEISYKRDLARSFMCIVSDEEWDSFEEECLQKGRIKLYISGSSTFSTAVVLGNRL